MTNEYHFQIPVAEEQIRKLNCGDVVYLSGIVHTMRDMGHRRAVDMLARGEKLPFDLQEGALWHCAPIVRKNAEGRWEAISAGPTTSSRFTYLGSDLIQRLKIRCTIGKGTMLAKAVQTMSEVGSCFLNATGGCAALYSGKIEEVVDVHWTDLGLPEATWVLRMKDFGPLIVGIDSHENSLFEKVGAKMRQNLTSIYEKSHLDANYNLSYLPRRVVAKAKSSDKP
jgi:fumarate hydratase subunit beta